MDAPADFEWDAAKAEANLAKHGFPFEAAAAIFGDPRCVVIDTVRAEDGEDRRKAVGSVQGRIFAVVFVMRGDVCRIISARRANATEERVYGHGQI